MLKKLYYRFHAKTSRPRERGEYSAGRWQDLVRTGAIQLCEAGWKDILEVGCGEGILLSRLRQRYPGANISGADVWEEILVKARAKNIKKVNLFRAGAESLPFESGSFDAVICVNVFFNMSGKENVVRALKEMSRVCAKGGAVIFDIRNSLNPLLFLKYKLAPLYDDTVKELPLKTYMLKDIRKYLAASGLEIMAKRYVGFPRNFLSPIIVVKAVKP